MAWRNRKLRSGTDFLRWKCDENSVWPGSVGWEEEGDRAAQSRPVYVGRYSSRAIFPQRIPASKKVEDFGKGVRRYMKKKHARR